MELPHEKRQDFCRSPILDSPRTGTDWDRIKALIFLWRKKNAGELHGFSDVEGDTFKLYVDMLGLNGRPLRDTFKPAATPRGRKRQQAVQEKKMQAKA